MNENIDLTKILKDCPEGFELYSSIHGAVIFVELSNSENSRLPIIVRLARVKGMTNYSKDGRFFLNYIDAECCLFPSKEQRDWSKFAAPWYKNEKFDPKTLRPFDKVLVRDTSSQNWSCGLFSHIVVFDNICKYNAGEILYTMCIPYNEDTKHLVGTTEKAPEYYRYWED